jgi:hypothetical protein
MSADDVAGAGSNRLDEESAGRQIAAGGDENQEWFWQSDDRQRAGRWLSREHIVEAKGHAWTHIP